jgi:hypothetical protein
MIRIIDGKRYDTERADLYRCRGGKYFWAHITCVDGESDNIEPCDIIDAAAFAAHYLSDEEYNDAFGDIVPDA